MAKWNWHLEGQFESRIRTVILSRLDCFAGETHDYDSRILGKSVSAQRFPNLGKGRRADGRSYRLV